MSNFFKNFGKVAKGFGNFIMPLGTALNHIAEGKVGQGLAEVFIPGYASYTVVKDIDNPESSEYIPEDSVVVEEVRSIDINNDGKTLGDWVDEGSQIVGNYIETNYGIDVPWVDDLAADPENASSGSAYKSGLLFGLIPLGIGLAFLL